MLRQDDDGPLRLNQQVYLLSVYGKLLIAVIHKDESVGLLSAKENAAHICDLSFSAPDPCSIGVIDNLIIVRSVSMPECPLLFDVLKQTSTLFSPLPLSVSDWEFLIDSESIVVHRRGTLVYSTLQLQWDFIEEQWDSRKAYLYMFASRRVSSAAFLVRCLEVELAKEMESHSVFLAETLSALLGTAPLLQSDAESFFAKQANLTKHSTSESTLAQALKPHTSKSGFATLCMQCLLILRQSDKSSGGLLENLLVDHAEETKSWETLCRWLKQRLFTDTANLGERLLVLSSTCSQLETPALDMLYRCQCIHSIESHILRQGKLMDALHLRRTFGVTDRSLVQTYMNSAMYSNRQEFMVLYNFFKKHDPYIAQMKLEQFNTLH